MEDKRASYTSADVIPVKVMQDVDLLDEARRIRPRHIQISITNKCNLNCSFCSCSNRDLSLVMPFEVIQRIANTYKKLGCVAVTITGGGEPLLHPEINDIIELFTELGIKIGLVTNGLLLDGLTSESIDSIEWIRISFDDSRRFTDLEDVLEKVCPKGNKWSFSYVVSSDASIVSIGHVVNAANRNQFSHVRIVSDLLNVDYATPMGQIQLGLKELGINDSLVIYQGRKMCTTGQQKCYISLLKPMIDTDGNIYPCCGAQYAKDNKTKAYVNNMCMGTVEDIESIYRRESTFNGLECRKCYYSQYNKLLGFRTLELNHREFV